MPMNSWILELSPTQNSILGKGFMAKNSDWEVLRNSQPSDYTGATGFAQMSAYDRLRWLDMAVDFVVRYRRFDRQGESV